MGSYLNPGNKGFGESLNSEIYIDKLFEKEVYIIDFLPERVLQENDGQFFDVEDYLLNSSKHEWIKDRFVNIILKLMCYYHITVLWDKWIDKPDPEIIENAVSEIMAKHSGTLNCYFPNEDMLLVFDWDCLNLSIYNPPKKTHEIFRQIALSEGMFWRTAI